MYDGYGNALSGRACRAFLSRLALRCCLLWLAVSCVGSAFGLGAQYYVRIWVNGNNDVAYCVAGQNLDELVAHFYNGFKYYGGLVKVGDHFPGFVCSQFNSLSGNTHWSGYTSYSPYLCGAISNDGKKWVLKNGINETFPGTYKADVANGQIIECGTCSGLNTVNWPYTTGFNPVTQTVSTNIVPLWAWGDNGGASPVTGVHPVLNNAGTIIGVNSTVPSGASTTVDPGTGQLTGGGGSGGTGGGDTGGGDTGTQTQTPVIDYAALYSPFAAGLSDMRANSAASVGQLQAINANTLATSEHANNTEQGIWDVDNLASQMNGSLQSIASIENNNQFYTWDFDYDQSFLPVMSDSLNASNGHWIELPDKMKVWITDPVVASVATVKTSADAVKNSVDCVKAAVDSSKYNDANLIAAVNALPQKVLDGLNVPAGDTSSDADPFTAPGNHDSEDQQLVDELKSKFAAADLAADGLNSFLSDIGNAFCGVWAGLGRSEPNFSMRVSIPAGGLFHGFDWEWTPDLTDAMSLVSVLRSVEVCALWLWLLWHVYKRLSDLY